MSSWALARTRQGGLLGRHLFFAALIALSLAAAAWWVSSASSGRCDSSLQDCTFVFAGLTANRDVGSSRQARAKLGKRPPSSSSSPTSSSSTSVSPSPSPSPAALRRMIVVARGGEDTTWLDVFFGDVPHVVVQQVDRLHASHATPRNMAKEAGAYLWWIVQNYDDLPDVMTFLHAHRRTIMHTADCDIVPLPKSLRWEAVTDYVGLVRLNRELNLTSLYALLWPTWQRLFEPYLGPIPQIVSTTTNAQFVVHKSRILHHPKAFWEMAYNFSMEEWGRNATERATSRHLMGLLFEHTWSTILASTSHRYGLTLKDDGPMCNKTLGGWVVRKFHDCDVYSKMAREFDSCAYMKAKSLTNE